MGRCEPGRWLGGRAPSRLAPFIRFVRRRRFTWPPHHREVARPLSTGHNGALCAPGRGPDAARGRHHRLNYLGGNEPPAVGSGGLSQSALAGMSERPVGHEWVVLCHAERDHTAWLEDHLSETESEE